MHRLLAPTAIVFFACILGTAGAPTRGAAAASPSEHAIWQLLAGPVDPPQMGGHVAIRDPARHRMVIVNGRDPRELWELSLPQAGSPRWTRRPIVGPDRPTARFLFAAVLDSARDRVILFGGRQGLESYNDVWALSLGDEPKWTRIEPEGEPPTPRDQTATIFDPPRDRVVIFGGVINADYEGMVVYSETWALNLGDAPRWEQLSPLGNGPARHKGASAIYDPWGERMIVFGGWEPYNLPPPIFSESFRPSNDTWALSLSGTPTWQRIEATSPPPARQEHVALVDPVGRRMIVTGGSYAQWAHPMNDTWALPIEPGALPEWSQMVTTGAVPYAAQHAAVCSPERGTLVQFGGEGNGNGTFELDLGSGEWAQIESDAPDSFPRRRVLPTLIAEPGDSRLLLFGGGWGCQHDLWSFPLAGAPAWTQLPTTGIAPVCGASHFVYDPARHRLLTFFGGYIAAWGQLLDQVWELRLDQPRVWTRLDVTGPYPPGRDSYSVVYDPLRDRVLLFGGASYFTRVDSYGWDRDDVWSLSLSDLTWTELHPVNSLGARRQHWAAYDPRRDRMLVVAGRGAYPRGEWLVPSCWSLDMASDSLRWSPLGPDAPVVQSAALDQLRNRVVLWDGVTTAWTLALDDPKAWTPLVLSGEVPTARDYFGLTYDEVRDQLLVFGGGSGLLKADLVALRFSDEVTIDVRPRGLSGRLPLHSRGSIEATILGSATFSVDSILPATVTLAGARATAPNRWSGRHGPRDEDGDDHPDLVLRFPMESMQVGPRDTVICLLGRTPNFGIRGFAPVRVLHGGRRHVRPFDATAEVPGLRLALTTPVASALELRFSLASSRDARIEVYDVAGRRVLARDLRGLAPGDHALQLEGGPLTPGLYFLRLGQDSQSVVARAVMLK